MTDKNIDNIELETLLEISPSPMIIETDGEITHANHELMDLFGIDYLESMIGKSIQDYISNDFIDKFRKAKSKLTTQRKSFTNRIKFQSKRGSIIVNLSIVRRIYRGKELLFYSLIDIYNIPIDDEEDIDKKFRILAEASPVGIVLMKNHRLIFMNPRALKLMRGNSAEDYIGTDVLEFVHKDYRDKSIERFKRLADGVKLPHIESKFVCYDGETIDVELTSSPIIYEGEPAVVSVFQDITQRKEMERKLKKNEELYRQMFEKNQAIKLMIDPNDGKIINANKAASKFYGYNVDELKNMNIKDLNTLPSNKIMEEMKKAENDEQSYFEFPHKIKNGEMRHVEVYSSKVEGENGNFLYSIIHDITERKRAEKKVQMTLEDLERSNEELEHFAHIISHDLKQPMSVLIGYLNLLKVKYQEYMNKDLDIIIEKMITRNHLMINMVDDLLSYSKIMTRTHPFTVCNCNEVLKQALINLEEIINLTSTQIDYKDLPEVMGNESLLISLFQNIIENSIKYAKSDIKPIINISIREDSKKIYPDNEWIFSFKDNGIGINEKDMNYIFQIFHRLKVKKNTKGSGIGLAFCKKIIERHKGKIWVESKEDEGSNFLFTLPKI